MKKPGYSHIFLMLSLLVASCSEFISPNASDLSLNIISPDDSLYTADNAVNFWWEDEPDAEQYHLRITQGSSGNLNLLVDTLMLDNFVGYTFPDDGDYGWEVRVENAATASEWQRYFFSVDRTAPEAAFALRGNGDTLSVNANGSLEWESRDQNTGGLFYPTGDSLYLFNRNDSTTIAARYFFAESDPRRFDFNATFPSPFNGPGTYYWQVASVDRAGNRRLSNQFRFIIQ